MIRILLLNNNILERSQKIKNVNRIADEAD